MARWVGSDPLRVAEWPIGLWRAALETMDDEASERRMQAARQKARRR